MINNTCECVEEKKNPTVKDLMIDNYEMLGSLVERLNILRGNLQGEEKKPLVANVNGKSIIDALKSQNDMIKYCHDYLNEIMDILG